jgi:hypothetical protein
MRTDAERLMSGTATGTIGARTLAEGIRRKRTSRHGKPMCVYDCGRHAAAGMDCCKTCFREAFTPLKFIKK